MIASISLSGTSRSELRAWDRTSQSARESNSVGEVAGVVCKVEGEENTGGNGVEGSPNNDMTDEGMVLRRLTKTHHTLSNTCSHV